MFRIDEKKPLWVSGGKSTAVEETERRRADRHMLTASAEVIEIGSGARFSTRTTDLGPGGCFIDTTNPFPIGAKVRVALRKGRNEFHTAGTVVYSQQGLGMGISFGEVDAQQQRALNAWLGEPAGEAHVSGEMSPSARYADAGYSSDSERATLVRLVRLMITKGILTEAEGSSVLLDPVL